MQDDLAVVVVPNSITNIFSRQNLFYDAAAL
jgi:hypothetical protein